MFFSRKRSSRKTSKYNTNHSRRVFSFEAIEQRLVLNAEMQFIEGEVIARVTSAEVITDLPEYLAEFDWQDILSPTTIENAESLFHLTQGNLHQYVFRIHVDISTDIEELTAQLSMLSFLDYAEPNVVHPDQTLLYDPGDPGITGCIIDYYENAGLYDAWDIARGAGVVIASFEGSYAPTHDDLAANVYINDDDLGDNVDDDDNGYVDDYYGLPASSVNDHGTRAASVAVGVDNSIGYVGIAPEAKIIAAYAGGSFINAIHYLLEQNLHQAENIRVAYSAGGFGGSVILQGEEDAVQYAVANRLLIVGSLGNDNVLTPGYGSDSVLVVSGIQNDGYPYYAHGPAVDILGQSKDVPIAGWNGDEFYNTSSGNSWVMPQVAGLAALIWSVPEFSDWSVEQVVARILGTAKSDTLQGSSITYYNSGTYGAGRYNAADAVDENVDIAPPTFEESLVRFNDNIFGTTVDEPLEAIWLYSRQLFSIESFTNVNNWELLWDGGDNNWDVYETIDIEPMQDYSIGSRWASIDIKEIMQNGNYKLIAKASGLEDPFGQALDGDGNGTGGDDFSYEFEYTGHPSQPQPDPLTQTLFSGSKEEAMLFAFRMNLDANFHFKNVFIRDAGVYAPLSWSLIVDWGDASLDTTEEILGSYNLETHLSTIATSWDFQHQYAEPGTYTIQVTAMSGLQYESVTNEIVVTIDDLGHLATVDHANGVKDLLIWGTEDEDFIKIEIDDLVMTVYGESTEIPSVIIDDVVLSGIDGRAGVFLYGGDDTFLGEDAPFAIEAHGGHGDDEIWTGFGNDTLGGWVDGDTILSELGNDTLRGGPGNDSIVDFGGLDSTSLAVDEDAWNWLYGGDGDDSIVMHSGWNVAWGDSGDDAGNDYFEVTAGRSFQIGGPGADTFVEKLIGEHLIITGIYLQDYSLYEDPMEWTIDEWFMTGTGHSFAERVATLSGSVESFTGEELIADLTIVDDGETDLIINSKLPPFPLDNIFPKTWYFLGFAEDEYYSQNAPNTGEVFSNTSPVVIDAVFSDDPSDHVDFTLSAGDAVRHTTTGPVALASAFNYVYRIDWDDDGNIDATLPGGNGVTTSHNYSDGNVYITRIDVKSYATPVDPTHFILAIGTENDDTITLDDDDGTTNVLFLNAAIFTTSKSIDGFIVLAGEGHDTIMFGTVVGDATVQVDAQDGDDTVLIELLSHSNRVTIHGGAGADMLAVGSAYSSFISMKGGTGDDALLLYDYLASTKAYLEGEGDNDVVGVFSPLAGTTTVVTALGGSGDDVLVGGHGNDSLDGGMGNDLLMGAVNPELDGDDTLIGGEGNDVLVGGLGADDLRGNAGQDLIVSGALSADMFGEEETPGVVQVWLQWLESEAFTTRIDRLQGILQSEIVLPEFVLITGQTVLDDEQADTIQGGTNEDWVMLDVGEDLFVDEETQDEVTDIGS